jgi:hypothetical protein
MEIIEKYPEKHWHWEWISLNPNLTMEMIEKYPEKDWNWFYISCNPNLTMEIIEKYPEKHWNWVGISCNPNISMEIIKKYPDKPWNWKYVSYNKFTKDKEQFEARVAHQKFVQENLFEEFVKAYMHPKRIMNLLELGYAVEELDDIM